MDKSDMLQHGGGLTKAARQYGIPLENWLDLSTGINPNGWPVPEIPKRCWARLPEEEDGLIDAAQDYYGAKHLLPVAGSQAAIKALPLLLPPRRVGLVEPGYFEHRLAWQRAGHRLHILAPNDIETALPTLDVLLLIHPNNPTGQTYDPAQLLDWHKNLTARDGLLIMDEAFMDSTPQMSLAPCSGQKGLVVVRSLGKFFGLAGARVGFVLAAPDLLTRLHKWLGPWTISGPSRHIAAKALQDQDWQNATRQNLQQESARLAALLAHYGLPPNGGCALFQWLKTPHAAALHKALARKAILTRPFETPPSLRLGLPANEAQWQRLEEALAVCRPEAFQC